MSKKIQMSEKDSWTVIEAIVAHEQAGGTKIPRQEGGVDVEFKLNGIEIDFSVVCKYIQERYHGEVKVMAASLAKEKIDNDFYKLFEESRMIEEVLQKTRKKLKSMINSEFGVYNIEDEE